MIPCNFDFITFCGLTTWDATIFQLVIGAIVASIFFIIQGKNTKMLNLISKERLVHLQKNTINNLLWMQKGCNDLRLEYKKVLSKPSPIQGLIKKFPSKPLKEFVSELKDANERTITAAQNYIKTHPETVSPQLKIALIEIVIQNKKIQITDTSSPENVTVLSTIIDQINLLNKKYNVKRRGESPESIYVNIILGKSSSERRNAALVFIIPGIIILLIPIISHGLFFKDILNDWVTYLGIYLVVLGSTFKSEKDVWFALWFIFGSIIMLALGILAGLNLIHL